MKIKPPVTKHKSVMIIDDNDIDNFINERILKSSLFAENVYVHTSAKSALEFLKNLESVKNLPEEIIPGYIFLDLNMPIMDGFQFMEAFQKFSDEFQSGIKIVILTTSLNPSDVETSKKYKQHIKFLYKPLNEAMLKGIE